MARGPERCGGSSGTVGADEIGFLLPVGSPAAGARLAVLGKANAHASRDSLDFMLFGIVASKSAREKCV